MLVENWITGLITCFKLWHITLILAGSIVGTFAGAIPGVSGTMALALAVPVSYALGPVPALLFLISIYVSSVYSGTISGILFRTPGAPESVAATLDGHAMAKQGKVGEALGIAISCSVIGGMMGAVALALISPMLSEVALQFGSPEYFAVSILGLSVVSSFGTKNQIKAITAALIGLFVACIGIDKIAGSPRFTFGFNELLGGVSFVPVIIGLFAVSEVIKRLVAHLETEKMDVKAKAKLPSLRFFYKLKGLVLRSGLIGTFIGILPGVGATTGSFVSYSEAVRWSRTPEKYGTGAPEGIAAAETANNAACSSSLIPLLTLGIPGSAGTAIILGAFLIHGMQPGPTLFVRQPELTYTIFVGMFLANLIIIFLAKLFITYFIKVVELPYTILGPTILICCIIGTFAVQNSYGHVWIMIAFAFIGFIMERLNYPLPPLILGVVLGPIAEENLRQTLRISGNDPLALVGTPLSAILFFLAAVSLFSPQIRMVFKKIQEIRKPKSTS